ncbi:hypothetical protein [Streptoalloteichus hindustanus]|uniref:Uncharacterized protein n=1 Tax=Streptoalloteichus hindustanus TaxID=2017 RepID=A0A1M5N035_STRHI|nr:hypothetical protein [Streptoalloteichus hindustanus]SHG82815.1 hypothetical protein SAMN05444320_114114 [Streptoalloteichus hindustanus]
MLRITADLFSGRPNPVWEVQDEARVRETLRSLRQHEDLLSEGVPAGSGLGFRGFEIESSSDELTLGVGYASSVYLPVGRTARGARANEFAEQLIDLLYRDATAVAPPSELPPLETPIQELLTAELQWAASQGGAASLSDASGQAEQPAQQPAAPAVTCTIEVAPYNPGFWNDNATTRRCNNCYNYASNWRTNDFAQPGLGCGSVYQSLSCDAVTRAALCDGMHHRYDCFPDSEKPRWLVALAVGPGYDYHWYRLMKEGFWGHKPGGTNVRNVDERNRQITDPQTADRGRYTHFCGYFYSCKTQQQRIRGYGC